MVSVFASFGIKIHVDYYLHHHNNFLGCPLPKDFNIKTTKLKLFTN